MHIEKMKVERFRLIREAEFVPFNEPVDYSELIVLAGPNGAGKSSVLELLSFGLASRYSWQYFQSRHITEHSFAIKVGLTQEEIGEIESSTLNDTDLVDYVKNKRGYWMEVNMPDAIEDAEMSINQRLHGVVSKQFQNFTKKLGFFLRADRGYTARKYNRNKLFNWKNKTQPNYFNNISYTQTTQQYEDMYDFLVEQGYHLQLMRSIKPQNQIWCATHSAELVDEAGRERTFFLKQSEDRARAECISATQEGAEIQILRDMFGYSGYVGISKKIVFSEGSESSADRKTFANIFKNVSRDIKIIPSGSYTNLYRLNAAILSLLESDFSRCEFYLIRDRDYLSQESVGRHRAKLPDRLFVLNRYHIENYLLEEVLVSKIFKYAWTR